MHSPIMKTTSYRPPRTVSRAEFLVDGLDSDFRASIYALVQCVGWLLACRDAFGQQLALTPNQFAVLMGVAHRQGTAGITIRELADHVALASTHVTTEVGRLERGGLLNKRPSVQDRRSVCVSLTSYGEAEIARVTPFVRTVNDALFRDVDAPSLAVVHRVARQIVVNSETALAEVRRYNLQTSDAAVFTSRAAGAPSPVASPSVAGNAGAGNGRRRKVKAPP